MNSAIYRQFYLLGWMLPVFILIVPAMVLVGDKIVPHIVITLIGIITAAQYPDEVEKMKERIARLSSFSPMEIHDKALRELSLPEYEYRFDKLVGVYEYPDDELAATTTSEWRVD